MSEFKFGDLVEYEEHEEHGLGVVAHGSVYFEDGDIYKLGKVSPSLNIVSRHQKWISVNDRLPEDWQCVDILINSQIRITDVAFDRNKFFGFPPACLEPWTEINNNVTHWMPLPDHPKE